MMHFPVSTVNTLEFLLLKNKPTNNNTKVEIIKTVQVGCTVLPSLSFDILETAFVAQCPNISPVERVDCFPDAGASEVIYI